MKKIAEKEQLEWSKALQEELNTWETLETKAISCAECVHQTHHKPC